VPTVDELQQLSGNVVIAVVVRNLKRVDVDAAALVLGQRSQRCDQTGTSASPVKRILMLSNRQKPDG
jgi:hypothetical protein